MKIVLTGGGTAGHITPNLAIADELDRYFTELHYIGGDGLESELVPRRIPLYHTISAVKLSRSKPLSNVKIPLALYKSIKESKELLTEISPDVVFSKGGYVALPVCLAAKSLGIPVVTHESDYSLGLANKLIGKVASLLLTSFPETDASGVNCRTICTGCPIRREIFNGNGGRAISRYKIKTDKPVLLVIGGSVGSKAINDAVVSAYNELTKSYSVVHISGKSSTSLPDAEHYKQIAYADDIADLFDLADIVVTRAGATALAELTALNKKILAIPLPKGSSRGDQVQNADSYRKKGMLDVLLQENLTKKSLVEAIDRTYQKPFRTDNSTENASSVVVNEILSVAKKRRDNNVEE